jgi:hypothetical protein
VTRDEVLAMQGSPELDALIHTRVMGYKCYHLHRRPVNPHTIRHANAAKDICDDCGARMYVSDFQRSQKSYSRNITAAKTVIEKLKMYPEKWAAFVEAFEGMLPVQGTAAAIVAAMNPEFVAKAALISTL